MRSDRIVRCCCWWCVQPWPEDALERVAYKFLEDVDIEPEEKTSTVNLCKYFHTSAAQLSSRYTSTQYHSPALLHAGCFLGFDCLGCRAESGGLGLEDGSPPAGSRGGEGLGGG